MDRWAEETCWIVVVLPTDLVSERYPLVPVLASLHPYCSSSIKYYYTTRSILDEWERQVTLT